MVGRDGFSSPRSPCEEGPPSQGQALPGHQGGLGRAPGGRACRSDWPGLPPPAGACALPWLPAPSQSPPGGWSGALLGGRRQTGFLAIP